MQAKVQASHAYNVAADKAQQAGAAVQDSAQRTTQQARPVPICVFDSELYCAEPC